MASRSAITSHQEWEKHRLHTRQPHYFRGLGRACSRTPDRSSGRPQAESRSVRPQATCGNRITRVASTIHGRFNRAIVEFDRTSLQLTWPHHRQQFFLPRIFQRHRLRTNHIFRKTLLAKYADARKLRERHAEELLTIGVLNEEQESGLPHRYAVVVQDLATQCIHRFPCKTKSAQETQRSLITFLRPEKTDPIILSQFSRISLRRAELES